MLPGLRSKFEVACIVLLLASGLVHACLFPLFDRPWNDPLSLRKAALFGISTGVTLWSCLWSFSNLKPNKHDRMLRGILCVSLVLEVFLITLQSWRLQASHFNRDGWINGSIESAMLLLITLAVLVIFVITYRGWKPGAMAGNTRPIAWAISWGMLLLSLSALIGYGITWIGLHQIQQGLSPYQWKTRGVLKFPHGAALHAIQTLALIAWLADRLKLANGVAIIHALALAHVCWLLYALYQTIAGLDRFELNATSMLLLAATGICCLIAAAFAIGKTKSKQVS